MEKLFSVPYWNRIKVLLFWQAVSHNGQVEMLQMKKEELHTTTMADNHPNKTGCIWSLPILENVLAANVINIMSFLHHYMNIQTFLEFCLVFGLSSNLYKCVL